MLKTASKIGAALIALFLCTSWDDHPDKCIGPDPDFYTDPNHSEGWTPEGDCSRDKSEGAAEHQGTCTGVPDRDK